MFFILYIIKISFIEKNINIIAIGDMKALICECIIST